MWSILATNEAVVRFLQHGMPTAPGLFSSTKPNRFAGPLLFGMFEIIFGLFGLCVGLAACILGFYNRKLTIALLVTQNTLGWYVYIDYMFIIPGFRISKIMKPMMPGLTLGASKFIGVMGILTSLAFCFALQGGQFVFMARLIAFSTDRDFLKQRTGAKMRAVFWNANLAFAGVWTVLQACVIISGVGLWITPEPFFAPPNVGSIPGYLLFNGVIMTVWPMLGIAISVSGRMQFVRKYAVMSFFVFLTVHLHYTIGQLSFLAAGPGSAGPAAGASLHNGLVLMICFLGPYFMLKQAQEATF